MASDELDVGVGLTFTMTGTALGARKIEDFTLPGPEVEILPGSHQGTTGALFKIPADLPDYGAFEMVLHHWQDYDYTADIGKVTTGNGCVITSPSGATVSFDGILRSYKPQRTTINDRMLADVMVEITTKPVIVAAA